MALLRAPLPMLFFVDSTGPTVRTSSVRDAVAWWLVVKKVVVLGVAIRRLLVHSRCCVGGAFEHQGEATAMCDIFTCTLVSCVIVLPLHLRTLPQHH